MQGSWSPSSHGLGGSRHSPTSGSDGRRSPNGRRSYQERITTVRFIHPATGYTMCTKLNRVQRTKAKPENGAKLCENFLSGHCDSGNNCVNLHVPKQYLWRHLDPHVNPATYLYTPGFNIRCYTPDMDMYYDIPSEFIYQTAGSDRYVDLFNDNGDNFKDKCRLCPVLQEKGSCPQNAGCEDIHCCAADLSQFPCIRTHRATEEAVKHYDRLPSDMVVRVYQPNTSDDGVNFPGNDLLRTAGATQYEEAYHQANGIPSLKMQHCAHFQNKKLCRMGDGCRFLHVVSIALATPMIDDEASLRTSPVQTAGRRLHDGECAMNEAAELAALAMAQDESRYIGSGLDNASTAEPNQHGGMPMPNYAGKASGMAAPMSAIYPSAAVPQRRSTGGRVSPYKVLVTPGDEQQQLPVAPMSRTSPRSPCMMAISPTANTTVSSNASPSQSRVSPVRRNNPYALSPINNSLH